MKKWITLVLAMSLMLTGCAAIKRESEQEKMEKAVTEMLSHVQNGKYDSLDQSFENMPERLASFIAFFSDENDNEIITEFQQMIQKETAKMSYQITDSSIDEENQTGTVTVEVTYVDLGSGLSDLAKTTFSSFLDIIDNWMNKQDNNQEIQSKLEETFENIDENYKTTTITFNMVKVDDSWMIGETDNSFVDIICGNAYSDVMRFLNSLVDE